MVGTQSPFLEQSFFKTIHRDKRFSELEFFPNLSFSQFNVSAKGFFSVYKEKMETRILDGAKSLIFEVSDCKDISLKPSDPPVKNVANTEAEEWHHKYQVNFRVEADKDPKEYLSDYFEKNIKQMGDAAVKISYVETEELPK